MSEDQREVDEEFFNQYDDLAVEVLEDTRPNFDAGMEMSNVDMVEYILEYMEWECFDLLQPMPFDDIYARGALHEIGSYMFLAYLRWDLFTQAHQVQIGDPVFNELARTHAEVWYLKLRDKYESMSEGQTTKHPWMQ